MKVTFNFLGLGFLNNFQAHIKIYDKCKLIYEEETYNGSISLRLKENKVYKVVVSTLYNEQSINILIDRNIYNLYFPYYNTSNIKTFLLTDATYSGLKIERGNIVVWPKQ